MHPARAARVAILHTWPSTQTEGWWRQAFDVLHIPYDYIRRQDVAKNPNLNAKYDVILFPPAGGTRRRSSRDADVAESDAVEEDSAHAEHRDAGPDRRHPSRTRLPGSSRISKASCSAAACSSLSRTPQISRSSSDSRTASARIRQDAARSSVPCCARASWTTRARSCTACRTASPLYSEEGESFSVSNVRGGRGGEVVSAVASAVRGRRAAARRTIPTCRRADLACTAQRWRRLA